MDLQELTAKMASKAGTRPAIGHKIKFDFGSDGCLYVDGTNGNQISNHDLPADCTITIALEDFKDLIKGTLNPMAAFMGGKIRIDGDMGVAMQLQNLL